jgi:hypothetical protein
MEMVDRAFLKVHAETLQCSEQFDHFQQWLVNWGFVLKQYPNWPDRK